MEQYILKDALVRKIDELDALNIFSDTTNKYNENYKCGYEDALESIRNFINTLEIKEVDLEKEIKEQIDKYYENCNKKLEEMGENDNDISFLTLDGFARHFYELGLKVQKER